MRSSSQSAAGWQITTGLEADLADINKSFSLKVLADVTAYQQELAKIPGVTEKQAAAAALRMEREMVKAAKATGAAAQAAASGGADALGKSFGQAKEQVALVAAGAAKISPELGLAVNTASAALGVIKSMVSPVGLVTAAVTAGGAAWVKFSGDVDKAMDRQNEAAKNAIKAQLGIVDSGAFLNRALEAQDKVSLLERKGQWIAFAKDYVEIFSLGGLNPIAQAGLDRLQKLEQAQADAITSAKASRDRNIELAKSAIDVAEAKKKEEEATKKATAAAKEAAEQAADAHAKYIEDLNERRDEEKALRKEQQRIEKEAEEAAAAQAKFTNDTIQAEQEASFDMYDQFLEQQDEEKRKAKETADARLATAQNLAGSMMGVAAAVFGDSKEIAMAEAAMNTASAVIAALKNPPGPPFSIVNAVAAGAMGAAQIAKIASTNVAHSGLAFDPSAGSRQAMAPDETPWKLRKNEGVLTARGVQGLGGYNQVRRLNAGQSPSMGSSFVGITQFKHKMLDATIGPNIARPAAARTEIKAIAASGGRVGHRLRSNS